MEQASRNKRGFKLSAIISFVVLISVLVTIVITTIVSYQAEKKSLYTNTIELNNINAKDMSKATQSLVLSMKKSIKVTAEYFSDETLTDENVLSQLDFFMNTNHYFNSIVIVNVDGTVVSTSPNNLGLIGEKLNSNAAQKALELKAPLISEPYQAVTKRLIVLVSHPIFDSEGNYKGFVAGSIYLQQPNIFQEILGTQNKNNNGSYFYVVDSSGTLIYHPDTNRIAQKVNENPVVKQLMKGVSGQQHVINSLGISYLAGYAIVKEVGWGIVSQTPESYINSTTQKLIEKTVYFSMPYLFILLIMTLWLSRKLTYPLNRLANYASRLSQGDHQLESIPVYTYWNYETNELTKTIALAFDRMKKKTDELSQEAQTDALTGLANRRTMQAITSLWKEQEIPFSIIMVDLDRFKLVNDTYGHQKGDEVLKFLAQMMMDEKRDQDFCCRYGGEEFTILLPETSEKEAYLIAERLRMKMATLISPIGRSVTLSLGISANSHAGEDLDTLLQYADEALYAAKEQGRNQTVMYSKMYRKEVETVK
ncbi:diguanylate cyclase [Paenibacillus selenitireducens]|uniref:Diguanylate cyclase n=1 Tax=Paenibacillus selenitireducens TaxID=1324314 RepID=A0A1T2X678_9BACL|nr:sensor domain-containing diguanylate cyclase [Paenibacillus selenitireducens]OPA75389.1 diguanylate cyclase [Paenibacillus selenitireducens]